MIELPSRRKILERIEKELDFIQRNCIIMDVQQLESHVRVVHILSLKLKNSYNVSKVSKKINW